LRCCRDAVYKDAVAGFDELDSLFSGGVVVHVRFIRNTS
jgi:hypothetical protein